jgi:serine/threonine protein kinase
LVFSQAKRKTLIGTPYWMAPEVLQSDLYDEKADIWSVGITAYEMAVGVPPHIDVHPMRAIFLIPSSDPPTLPEPERYSASFHHFLETCLVKDAGLRPSALELLKHPFVANCGGQDIIASLVNECREEIDNYRIREQMEQQEVGLGNTLRRSLSLSLERADNLSWGSRERDRNSSMGTRRGSIGLLTKGGKRGSVSSLGTSPHASSACASFI